MQWSDIKEISYKRLITRQVAIGNLLLGNNMPIRVQTMTTTDTMDTAATVAQSIRCIEAGAEMVRITAPSKTDAENLLHIKNQLRSMGYHAPLIADIHFTPNAAEVAARIVEKVRVNPGNYVDKKKFEFIEYTDALYKDEIERIRERFTPLIKICKEYGTAMRIGTNHGSLSDRIMSRFGDTPMGMVESAMEFLRIARDEQYHQVVLSMKSSNPIVMVEAYRLLVEHMQQEFGECYPLHLGVTEAGDGEDGRIKSAIGIGTLLNEGIGDTIRVSLTEDPEFEIPVCTDLVKKYNAPTANVIAKNGNLAALNGSYKRRETLMVDNIGGTHVPIVVADFMKAETITHTDLQAIGYTYHTTLDKWNIGDAAADYIYIAKKEISFPLPGTLQAVQEYSTWIHTADKKKNHPLFQAGEIIQAEELSPYKNFVALDVNDVHAWDVITHLPQAPIILCLYSSHTQALQQLRLFVEQLNQLPAKFPLILAVESMHTTIDEQLIHFSEQAGALMLDGIGDGIWLINDPAHMNNARITGRTYLEMKNNHQFLNNTSFSILQATRTRISKTEYISCPSCGRTLFELQETTAKIRSVTHHLKGLKIAIMGCIVNGPGEMADADYGYVGSGPGKITLYKGKEVVKRNVASETAVDELIQLLKDYGDWVEKT